MKLFTCLTLLMGVTHSHAGSVRGNGVQPQQEAPEEVRSPALILLDYLFTLFSHLPRHYLLNLQRELQSPIVIALDDYYRVQEGTRLEVNNQTALTMGFLENDFVPGVPLADILLIRYTTVGFFQGTVSRINPSDGGASDGLFRYDPADGFVGFESFNYTACYKAQPWICNWALVNIEVFRDPLKPNRSPIARDDTYETNEGTTLSVNGQGIFNNDEYGVPTNPMIVCGFNDDGIGEGGLTLNADNGQFDYEIARCFTGAESFTYQACYQDYPEMISNTATVTISVVEDPDRPSAPDAQDDTYTVHEADTLEVSSSNGLLSNDGSGELVIDNHDEKDGFVGDLDVDDDGSFEYTAISGQLGTFEFFYTVCHEDWECVDCKTVTAKIEVTVNPNKPLSPPDTEVNTIGVVQGEVYRDTLMSSVGYDERYTLEFMEIQTRNGFGGTLDTDEDGNFAYGNAPVGADTFDYQVCYKEWPDLCSTGNVVITTKPDTSGSTSRRGVATFYGVSWGGKDESGGCSTIQPKLALTCGGAGEIQLIESGLPNDNAICTTDTAKTTVSCAAQPRGTVYAECRDGSSSNNVNRKITATLFSDPVSCGPAAPTDFGNLNIPAAKQFVAPPYHTYHVSSVKTWCNDEWIDNGNTCSATPIDHAQWGNLCYQDQSTSGASAQPPFVTMSSISYETCVVTGPTAPEKMPVLEEVGNGEQRYPINLCSVPSLTNDTHLLHRFFLL